MKKRTLNSPGAIRRLLLIRRAIRKGRSMASGSCKAAKLRVTLRDDHIWGSLRMSCQFFKPTN
jgi:hypothetical protein